MHDFDEHSGGGDNIVSLAKRQPPRKPWPDKVVAAIEGLIGEVINARLAVLAAENAELRARVERLERITRHLDTPLHEVDP